MKPYQLSVVKTNLVYLLVIEYFKQEFMYEFQINRNMTRKQLSWKAHMPTRTKYVLKKRKIQRDL